MAHSIRCKYCGWYEADHIEETDDKVQKGYRISLDKCAKSKHGYIPEDMALHRRQDKLLQAEETERLRREYGDELP